MFSIVVFELYSPKSTEQNFGFGSKEKKGLNACIVLFSRIDLPRFFPLLWTMRFHDAGGDNYFKCFVLLLVICLENAK